MAHFCEDSHLICSRVLQLEKCLESDFFLFYIYINYTDIVAGVYLNCLCSSVLRKTSSHSKYL